jgi:Zn-dependent protease
MADLDLNYILSLLPGIILGLTIHEYMHARVSLLLGDTTSRDQGRITLNPLRHIDWLGFIFIIFAGFGWAKPVQINGSMLKHPRRDEMLIAASGPLSNLLVGILCTLLIKGLVTFIPVQENQLYTASLNILFYAVFINYGLFIFNILPIPPLDGSHLFFNVFNIRGELLAKMFRYGTMILFAIILIESQTKIDILPLGKAIRFMAGQSFKLVGIDLQL